MLCPSTIRYLLRRVIPAIDSNPALQCWELTPFKCADRAVAFTRSVTGSNELYSAAAGCFLALVLDVSRRLDLAVAFLRCMYARRRFRLARTRCC